MELPGEGAEAVDGFVTLDGFNAPGPVKYDKVQVLQQGPADADRLTRVIDLYQSNANFGRSTRPAEPEPAPEPTLFDGLG